MRTTPELVLSAATVLRLGPMVTALGRRRPAKVARETATLDMLSGERLTTAPYDIASALPPGTLRRGVRHLVADRV